MHPQGNNMLIKLRAPAILRFIFAFLIAATLIGGRSANYASAAPNSSAAFPFTATLDDFNRADAAGKKPNKKDSRQNEK